jgi:hypothetical protein
MDLVEVKLLGQELPNSRSGTIKQKYAVRFRVHNHDFVTQTLCNGPGDDFVANTHRPIDSKPFQNSADAVKSNGRRRQTDAILAQETRGGVHAWPMPDRCDHHTAAGPSDVLSRLRLRDLGLGDVTVIANTFLLLLAVQPSIRLAGLKLTARWARLLLGPRNDAAPLGLNDLAIERIARLIGGCCQRWPFRTTCLDRSFVSLVLLGRRGIPVTLFMGFSRNNEGVEGHAWIEVDERPLAEPIDVKARYSRQVLIC